jgi:hypothetical protein
VFEGNTVTQKPSSTRAALDPVLSGDRTFEMDEAGMPALVRARSRNSLLTSRAVCHVAH